MDGWVIKNGASIFFNFTNVNKHDVWTPVISFSLVYVGVNFIFVKIIPIVHN